MAHKKSGMTKSKMSDRKRGKTSVKAIVGGRTDRAQAIGQKAMKDNPAKGSSQKFPQPKKALREALVLKRLKRHHAIQAKKRAAKKSKKK